MECSSLVMPVLIQVFECFVLFALVILIIFVIITVRDADKLVKDISRKSSKLNGAFDLVDKSSSAVTGFVDTISDVFTSKDTQKKEGKDNE